eukprot:TRINITY_DN29916_c0_g1_i1.p1 TRINITY_DN29916_c0_g1~~TRINITY_DN29916_c0_g1_i1.p1  ORF type:complete len:331 (+),score=78.30 TRINITY_DN29916_c0_g1_i1:69-1061(+)
MERTRSRPCKADAESAPSDKSCSAAAAESSFPLFGACTACSPAGLEESDRGCKGFSRMRKHWADVDICASDSAAKQRRRKRRGSAAEMAEDDSSNDGSVEFSGSEDDSSGPTAPPVASSKFATPGGSSSSSSAGFPLFGRRTQHQQQRVAAVESVPVQDSLQHELEAVMWRCGDVFISRGWELRPSGSGEDRYELNGRSVKMQLVRLGTYKASYQHLARDFDLDVAERAARIIVCDGSLRQPLLDYLLQSGQNESYDQRGTENVAGVTGPAKYLDFNSKPTGDRLSEMNMAMVQAAARRQASGNLAGPRLTALQYEGHQLLVSRPPRQGR